MSGIFFLKILLVKRPILYKYFHSIKFCQENLGQNHHLTKNVPVFWALSDNLKKTCHVYKFTGFLPSINAHQTPFLHQNPKNKKRAHPIMNVICPGNNLFFIPRRQNELSPDRPLYQGTHNPRLPVFQPPVHPLKQ